MKIRGLLEACWQKCKSSITSDKLNSQSQKVCYVKVRTFFGKEEALRLGMGTFRLMWANTFKHQSLWACKCDPRLPVLFEDDADKASTL